MYELVTHAGWLGLVKLTIVRAAMARLSAAAATLHSLAQGEYELLFLLPTSYANHMLANQWGFYRK